MLLRQTWETSLHQEERHGLSTIPAFETLRPPDPAIPPIFNPDHSMGSQPVTYSNMPQINLGKLDNCTP